MTNPTLHHLIRAALIAYVDRDDLDAAAPSPRSEAEGTRAPACHCGDVLRERPCPFCSPEAYYGAGRAPVPAESATWDLLRVIENPAVPDGTAYMLSVVEGPDGEKRLDAVKVTGIGAAATKGEEDGR